MSTKYRVIIHKASLIVALVLPRLDYCNSMLYGLPAYLLRRLQSVLNAAARLIFRIRRSEYISPALISLHWLRVPECISFKLALLTYRSIRGTAPRYLQSCFSHHLAVSHVRLSTVGKRAFSVSGATVWNDLPPRVTSAPSLVIFRQRLKLFLFSQCYADTVSYTHLTLPTIYSV